MSIKSSILLLISLCTLSVYAKDYYERVDSADIYIARNKWADAERTLKEALRLEPGNILNSMLLSNLGYVQHTQGKLQEAIESYDVALAMTPNSLVLLKNRANALIDAGLIDRAYDDLTAAIDIEPDNQECRSRHGFVALQLGKYDSAKADFETILSLHPSSADALLGMTISLDYLGQYDSAIDYATQLIDLQKNADNYFTRALLYIKVNNLPAADDDVREGLKIDNREGNLYLLRAYLHKLRYRKEEAEIDKKLAIDYNADAQLIQQLFP